MWLTTVLTRTGQLTSDMKTTRVPGIEWSTFVMPGRHALKIDASVGDHQFAIWIALLGSNSRFRDPDGFRNDSISKK